MFMDHILRIINNINFNSILKIYFKNGPCFIEVKYFSSCSLIFLGPCLSKKSINF